MLDILRPDAQHRGRRGTLSYEGVDHGAGVSIYLVDGAPGMTVAQHVHPYSETWIIRAGEAEMTIGGETFVGRPGDIVTAGPNTPHGFRVLGDTRLDMICIHASERFVQEWV